MTWRGISGASGAREAWIAWIQRGGDDRFTGATIVNPWRCSGAQRIGGATHQMERHPISLALRMRIWSSV